MRLCQAASHGQIEMPAHSILIYIYIDIYAWLFFWYCCSSSAESERDSLSISGSVFSTFRSFYYFAFCFSLVLHIKISYEFFALLISSSYFCCLRLRMAWISSIAGWVSWVSAPFAPSNCTSKLNFICVWACVHMRNETKLGSRQSAVGSQQSG